MKKEKSAGADGISAEVWKESEVVKQILYEFLQKVWYKEEKSVRKFRGVYFRYALQEQRIHK